jgi:TonB family protein
MGGYVPRLLTSELSVIGLVCLPSLARAQVVAAEPDTPIVAAFPEGAPNIETQVVLQLVIGPSGEVESVVVASHAPAGIADSFDVAALEAARRTAFHPSTRDGHPIRSRIEYVVVFHPDASHASVAEHPVQFAPGEKEQRGGATASGASSNASSDEAGRGKPAANQQAIVSANEQDEDYAEINIYVPGVRWPSPRGVGDLRIKRDLIEASPRQQASEMLAAAPGFFVDHEDGEGIGNDVYLRGFELEHGSGIEMRVGTVPINNPVHVQGQGYADANFIIPEVVRSIRVLEGPYDPRQGDAAVVGSAYFDLGVPARENVLKASYGSWNQKRIVGITAPKDMGEETFAAFALRKTDGFGQNRASESGTLNAQYGFDLGAHNHVRLLATAYGVRSALAGVLREADVNAGRIGAYDGYPYFAQNQGVQSSRFIVGADFDSTASNGAHFEFAPWAMWTSFRARQNYSGNIYSSQIDPELAGGLGDLWETTNLETAMGLTARYHTATARIGSWLEVAAEPGFHIRGGHTDQAKSLLSPTTLQVWDRRLDDGLQTLDAGGYLDLDLRFWKRLRVSGGVRADLLAVVLEDRLGYSVPPAQAAPGAIAGSTRATQGIAVGPRVTVEYAITPRLTTMVAYGEGFRSLNATSNVATSTGTAGAGPSIHEGGRPYSKVRSVEAGLRAAAAHDRYTTMLSIFETRVDNELVFEASSGGFTTQGRSVRRGVVGSALARPCNWLLASVAASVASATYATLVPGLSQYVPNVPPLLLRADATVHGVLVKVANQPLIGRVGVGYTYLAGRHLTDAIVGPSSNILNASAGLRRGAVELGIEAYNVLDLRYADDAEYYVSNFSLQPGTALASGATHLSMAPPFTLLGTLAVNF